MKFNGTKGPWRASVLNENFGPKVWGPDDRLVADCGNIRKRTEEEEYANAQLIACAPEMLVMLAKWSILNESYYKDLSGFILKTREIIEKATTI